MALNRRRFLGAGAAALTAACGPLAGCGGAKDTATSSPVPAPGSTPGPAAGAPGRAAAPAARTTEGLVFDVTGLFAVELWRKGPKKAKIVLVDGIKAGLDPAHGLHAPLLLMRWDDVDHKKTGPSYYEAPQPIRVGGQTMAMWSLQDRVIWVEGPNPTGYDTDPSSALDVITGVSQTATSPASDGEWTDLHWLSDMREALKLGTGAPLPIAQRSAIYSEVLLTRGLASIRKPLLQCEDDALYHFEYPDKSVSTPRTYGTQLGIEHPAAAGDVNVMIGMLVNGVPAGAGKKIPITVQPGQLTPISVMNGPISHPVDPTHFNAFFHLAGLKDPKLWSKLVVDKGCGSKAPAEKGAKAPGPSAAMMASPSRGDNSASPYDGCVPPGFMQD